MVDIGRDVVRRETKAVERKIFKKKKLPFSYSAQPKKVVVYCSCGAKKYSFGSTIAG